MFKNLGVIILLEWCAVSYSRSALSLELLQSNLFCRTRVSRVSSSISIFKTSIVFSGGYISFKLSFKIFVPQCFIRNYKWIQKEEQVVDVASFFASLSLCKLIRWTYSIILFVFVCGTLRCFDVLPVILSRPSSLRMPPLAKKLRNEVYSRKI